MCDGYNSRPQQSFSAVYIARSPRQIAGAVPSTRSNLRRDSGTPPPQTGVDVPRRLGHASRPRARAPDAPPGPRDFPLLRAQDPLPYLPCHRIQTPIASADAGTRTPRTSTTGADLSAPAARGALASGPPPG